MQPLKPLQPLVPIEPSAPVEPSAPPIQGSASQSKSLSPFGNAPVSAFNPSAPSIARPIEKETSTTGGGGEDDGTNHHDDESAMPLETNDPLLNERHTAPMSPKTKKMDHNDKPVGTHNPNLPVGNLSTFLENNQLLRVFLKFLKKFNINNVHIFYCFVFYMYQGLCTIKMLMR